MVRGERPGGRVGGRHRHPHRESHPPYRPLLVRLPEAIREALPADLQGFRVRFGAGLVKLYYGHPNVHFEAWFHTRTQRIEVGLHFEGDRETNAELLRRFDERLLEIKARLGPHLELEPWEKGWVRLYETFPIEPLSDELLGRLSRRVAEVIQVLQPLYEELSAG